MSITWNKIVADEPAFKDLAYNTLKEMETSPNSNWLEPIPASGNSGITIGLGYDLKQCLDPVRIAVLQAMGLQTNLLQKRADDPTSLSASELIEVDYVDQLWTLVQGTNLQEVHDKMLERSTDAALIAAMAAEGQNYELRASFHFNGESEVKQVWDNAAYNAYAQQVDNLVGPVTNQPNYLLSKERAALFILNWNSSTMAQYVGQSMQAGNRAEAWFKIRYLWKEGTGADANKNNGWAKRRYLESEIFGLYDNPSNVSPDEAKQVYRMFQSNFQTNNTIRWRAYQRENKYGVRFDGQATANNMIAAGNNDYKNVLKIFFPNEEDPIDTIIEALNPAKDALFGEIWGHHT